MYTTHIVTQLKHNQTQTHLRWLS